MGTTPLTGVEIPDLSDAANAPSFMSTFGAAIEKLTVMRFATEVARDAAITAPEEGMVTYITGDDRLYIYSGAAWVRFATSTTTGRTGVTISRSTNQSIADNTITAVSFTTEGFDSDTMFAATASTFTVATGQGGLWALTAVLTWATSPGATCWAAISIGGVRYTMAAAGNTPMAVSITLPVAAGAVIGVDTYQNSGGAINITAATLTGYRLGV